MPTDEREAAERQVLFYLDLTAVLVMRVHVAVQGGYLAEHARIDRAPHGRDNDAGKAGGLAVAVRKRRQGFRHHHALQSAHIRENMPLSIPHPKLAAY